MSVRAGDEVRSSAVPAGSAAGEARPPHSAAERVSRVAADMPHFVCALRFTSRRLGCRRSTFSLTTSSSSIATRAALRCAPHCSAFACAALPRVLSCPHRPRAGQRARSGARAEDEPVHAALLQRVQHARCRCMSAGCRRVGLLHGTAVGLGRRASDKACMRADCTDRARVRTALSNRTLAGACIHTHSQNAVLVTLLCKDEFTITHQASHCLSV